MCSFLLIIFLLPTLVSISFLALVGYSFLIFFFISTCVTFRPLVKQTTTRNLYITIYIYFLDGRLCKVGAVRRGIKIVRR